MPWTGPKDAFRLKAGGRSQGAEEGPGERQEVDGFIRAQQRDSERRRAAPGDTQVSREGGDRFPESAGLCLCP